MSALDFDQVVDQCHLALGELGKGNPEPVKALFSHRVDVSAAGGFGGVMLGWAQVAKNTEFAASRFQDRQVPIFENVVKYATHDLGYIVEIERYEAKVGEREDMARVVLRSTSIFRLEDGAWKLVHRHGDPIVSIQEADSVILKQISPKNPKSL